MTTTLTTPDAVLDAAADYFAADPDRWGRDCYLDAETGCRCTMGAITWVFAPDHWDGDPYHLRNRDAMLVATRAVGLLHDYLIDHHGVPVHIDSNAVTVVADWNDEQGRTVSDVIMLLRSTAADYRKRQAQRAAREWGAA